MTAANDTPDFVVLGLAGGIGAGKSYVAAAFGRMGFEVCDSDAQARSQLEEPQVRAALVARWGAGVLGSDGRIDRGAVASIVFARPEERAWLEGVVHPRLKAGRAERIAAARRDGRPGVVIDAPLLFEAGVDQECDAVVWVEAPAAERLRRVRARGWDEAELARREAAQWPLEEKRARCAYTVVNADGRADVDEQVRSVSQQVINLIRQRRAGTSRRPA